MKELAEEGWKHEKIAQEIGCNQDLMGKYLKKLGISTVKKLTSEDRQQIEKYEEAGLSQAEMGQTLGVTASAVSYHRQKKLQPLSE